MIGYQLTVNAAWHPDAVAVVFRVAHAYAIIHAHALAVRDALAECDGVGVRDDRTVHIQELEGLAHEPADAPPRFQKLVADGSRRVEGPGAAASPVAINFGQPAIRPTNPPVWSHPAGTPATKNVTRASSPAAAISCASAIGTAARREH